MSEIVNQSLQKIAKGTGIIFIGTMIGMLLGFIGRVILVRYITQTEYGIYCLEEAVQQSKNSRKRKENRALNQKRSKIFSVKSNCGTASGVYKIIWEEKNECH